MKKILLIILCLFLVGCSTTQTAVQNAEVIPESLRPLVDLNGADRVVEMHHSQQFYPEFEYADSFDSLVSQLMGLESYYFVTNGNDVLRAYDASGDSKDAYLDKRFIWSPVLEEYLTNHYIHTISPEIIVKNAYLLTSNETNPVVYSMVFYDTNQGPYVFIAWSYELDTQYMLPWEAYLQNMQTYNKIGDFSSFIDMGLMEPYDVHSWSFLMNVWYTPWVAGGILLLVSAATVSIFWFKRKSRPCKTKTQ